LDFLNLETGETEKQLFCGEAIRYVDINEDLPEILVSDDYGVWTYDPEEDRYTTLWNWSSGFPYYVKGYRDIVCAGSDSVVRRNIETLKGATIFDVEDIDYDRIGSVCISPDREYLAVYVEKQLFFGFGEGLVVIVRIQDGKRAVLLKDAPIESAPGERLQWIDE
jgi:hypothetical protein